MLRSVVLSYLIGSVPNAYLFARWFGGRDIRRVGSRNAGTTNVALTVGWLPGLLTLVGDVGKGYLAALVGEVSSVPVLRFITPAFAIAGHNWPVWLRFRGGGGLATFIGACLRLTDLLVPLAALALWGLLYLTGLGHNRSAVLACILLPGLMLVTNQPAQLALFVSTSSLVILLRRLQSIYERARGWRLEGELKARPGDSDSVRRAS